MPRKKTKTTNTDDQCQPLRKSRRLENAALEAELKFLDSEISPVTSVTAEDEPRLLQVFPEELWIIILDKIKDSTHLVQISNSSPFLRRLLFPRQTEFLFPLVWNPILGNKYEKCKHQPYMENKGPAKYLNHLKSSGKLRNTKWFSGVLKLRQVCKTWCLAIDTFYQNTEDIYKFRHDTVKPWNTCKADICNANNHEDGCWTRVYQIFSSEQLNDFLNHFQNSHQGTGKSPFISNKVQLTFEGDAEYFAMLNIFLEYYGKYIWHCDLLVEEDDIRHMTGLVFYRKFRESLLQMPNMLSFRIWYDSFVPRITGQQLKQLKLEMAQNPLPELQNLEFLKSEYLPEPILNQLLERNGHLAKIDLKQGERDKFSQVLAKNYMPNLVQLSIEIRNETEFRKLKKVQWNKLQKIYLDFSNCCYIPWSEIFKVVEANWSNSATEVMLHLPKVEEEEENIVAFMKENHQLQLYLPKVKKLRLALGNVSSIDFILPMKNQLEYLAVFEAYDLPYGRADFWWNENGFWKCMRKGSKIKVFGSQRFNGWNAFTELPKLQCLEYYGGEDYVKEQPFFYAVTNYKI